MPSPRTTLKNDIVTAIKTASTIAGNRVYKGRRQIVAGGNFPTVFVWMIRDDAVTNTLDRARQRMHTMSLAVDYWAKAATSDALEDTFDTAADAIRAAVCSDAIAGAPRQDVVLTSTEFLYEGDEDQPFGCARLTITCTYLTAEP